MKFLFSICLTVLAICGEAQTDLMGAWEVDEIHWITPDTTLSIHSAQPGIFMMTETSYAFIWTPTPGPRKPFQILAEPTPEEAEAAFKSIVFNSGQFEFANNILTTTSTIARVPGFEGGKQMFEIEQEGDNLELTMFDETYPNGEKPKWIGHMTRKFVLSRIK